MFQDPNNNWAFALWKATLIIYIHVYPFSGGCNGTTSDQGRHKLLQAPVNIGEMAENLGKSSNTIYYNNMVSTIIYTQEVFNLTVLEMHVVKCMVEIFQEMFTGIKSQLHVLLKS